MLVEEKIQGEKNNMPGFHTAEASQMDVEEADTFDEPQAPGIFEKYVAERTKTSDVGSAKRTTRTATSRKRPTHSVGPMSKFMKA